MTSGVQAGMGVAEFAKLVDTARYAGVPLALAAASAETLLGRLARAGGDPIRQPVGAPTLAPQSHRAVDGVVWPSMRFCGGKDPWM